MPFDDALDTTAFKTWLVKTIEPLCDADPVVMSDYIIALLKHDAVMEEDEWKTFMSRELVDFLEDSAKGFVDDLFQTLNSKSYLPPIAKPPSPPKGPSLVSSYVPSAPSAQPVAGPSTASRAATSELALEANKDVSMEEVAAQQAPGRPRRQKCYDYHERGFCMRGANCPYEHSEDVIIPTPEMMFAQFPPPFMGVGGPGGPGRGNGRGRGRGRGNVFTPHGNGNGHMMGPGQEHHGFPVPFSPMARPGAQSDQSGASNNFMGSNRPPSDRTSTSLVITDIPPASLSIQAITSYFERFGDVTNVALEAKNRRALISFATNLQAFAAWKSEDAIFGSRHVKVLWHRPRPGQGAAGQEALEKSAELLANMKKINNGEGPQGNVKAKLSGPESRLRATLAELEVQERKAKQETLMAEQKVLLKRAEGASKEEKIQILTRLKELSKEMEELKKPKKEEAEDVQMSEKEKLDRELAKHGMETTEGKDQDELLKLSAQLSALRDKANTLGIDSSARYSPYSRPRGRGAPRARGRGRGGPPRPMRLDNRSRVIDVTGDVLQSEEGRHAAQEWYESTGGAVQVVDGGLRVTYSARDAAERALAKGTKEIIDAPGGIQATWHTAPIESSAPDVEMADDDDRRGERDEEE
ncbi:hypothetical protein IAR55_006269 [Kwoniella newhampshirensis]|uniref:C3H1-type domain-containing protein n=1 Tax=Kwoniella newhampshirensis TaxID=1651941 RepID=A0AAW0YG37_9TREE